MEVGGTKRIGEMKIEKRENPEKRQTQFSTGNTLFAPRL